MSPQTIYDSAWHHPGIAWVSGIVAALLFARRQRFLIGWFTVFLVVSLADAWSTGAVSRIPAERAWIAGVVFVILGDLRFFLLAERYARGRLDRKAAATAFAMAMLVPITTEVVRRAVPIIGATPRYTFLFYEVMLLALALASRFVIYPSRLLGVVSAPVRQWVLGIASLVAIQYGLWVAIDLLLVAGVEVALLLRIVPNTVYYGVFLPYVVLRAPPAAWGEGRSITRTG